MPSTQVLTTELINKVGQFDPALILPPQDGYRKISTRLLSPPHAPEPSSSPPAPAAKLSPSASPAPTTKHTYIPIPTCLHSKQALQFVGFSAPAAAWMDEQWFQHPLDPYFPSCIFDNVEKFLFNARLDGCDWQEQMGSIGLSEETQEGIMDERFKGVRGILDLRVWVVGFVRENLRVLRGMNERIERNLEIVKNRNQQQPRQHEHFGTKIDDRGSANDTPNQADSNVTTLYRATTYSKLHDTYRSGKLQLETMSNSTWLADFSHERAAYYFSPQRWVAKRHAAYLARNARIPGDIFIFSIHIPTSLLPKDKVWDLRMDMEAWKQLFWHSRTWKMYPDELNEKWEKSVGGCIIGPVSWSEDVDGFKGMKSWNEVKKEEHVWRNEDGEMAVQYGFVGVGGMVRLNGRVVIGWERFENGG